MKKRLLQILIIPAICIFPVLAAFSQEDMEVVEADGFQNRQRPPAVFKHDDHNELAEIEECNECHHIYEDGEKLEDESSEDQQCSACHRENSTAGQPGLKKAYHLNCKGCHQAKRKGPIMCGQCHVR